LDFQWKYDLPDFAVKKKSYPSHGRFLFFNAAGTRILAIVQADAASGLSLDYVLSARTSLTVFRATTSLTLN
jgi:hypothetical protein